jgi:hypothetical protein
MKIRDVLAISVLGAATILALASVAGAYPAYLAAFNSRYNAKGSRLDTCSTCHGTNYQDDIAAQLQTLGDIADALRAVEPLDSDGDKYANIDEVTARTFPGDVNDFPGHLRTDKDGGGRAAAAPVAPLIVMTAIPTFLPVLPRSAVTRPTATKDHYR